MEDDPSGIENRTRLTPVSQLIVHVLFNIGLVQKSKYNDDIKSQLLAPLQEELALLRTYRPDISMHDIIEAGAFDREGARDEHFESLQAPKQE